MASTRNSFHVGKDKIRKSHENPQFPLPHFIKYSSFKNTSPFYWHSYLPTSFLNAEMLGNTIENVILLF